MKTKTQAGGILILALHEKEDKTWTRQFAGMRRYAGYRSWRVVEARCDKGDLAAAENAVLEHRPAGVVSSLSVPLAGAAFESVKTVYFDCPVATVPEGAPFIRNDALAIAHLAAGELFTLNCKSYSFAGQRTSDGDIPAWSGEREDAFRREIAKRGGRFLAPFRPPSPEPPQKLLAAWLAALEKPCGILAANDAMAAEVRRAAAKLGLRMPGDVAITGVDDDPRFCLRGRPALTSIAPDWEMGGYAAAATLGSLLDGRKVEMSASFRPLGLMRRETTARMSRDDARIVAAVSLIRAKACRGLGAVHVASFIKGSRRFAEKLFRDVTGSSILEEIRRVRFDAAKLLLSHTSLPLAQIVSRIGCESVPSFCRDFKAATGFAPRLWRDIKTPCANG